MIALQKSAKPDILVQNEKIWTDEYVALKAGGGKNPLVESRHRHSDIKNHLIEETSDKCVYCEQKLRASQFGDVEHILPKRHYPNLYVAWENLTLGCNVCNTHKGDRIGFINPYDDDPDEHLKFCGPMVGHLPGDVAGRQTERGLRLNRLELVGKRTDRLTQLQDTIDLYESTAPGPLRDILEEELRDATRADKEFSAFVRQYIIDLGYGAIL